MLPKRTEFRISNINKQLLVFSFLNLEFIWPNDLSVTDIE